MRALITRFSTGRVVSLVFATAIAAPSSASAQPMLYTIEDLGTLGSTISLGGKINSAGQVAGSYTPVGGSANHAFRSSPNGQPVSLTNLGTLGGNFSRGQAINAAGQVAGFSTTAGGVNHAFRTTSTGLVSEPGTDLGTIGTGQSIGNSINASGQVAGWYDLIIGGFPHPQGFRTTATGLVSDPGTGLGTLGGLDSLPAGINTFGQVTGSSLTSSGTSHAFRTTALGLISDPGTDLGTLGGTRSSGNAINDAGQVAGSSNHAGSNFDHAFRSSPNGQQVSLTDLGTLGGDTSAAFDINALGVLVGSSALIPNGSDSHAFVYDTQMRDLNALLVNGLGWELTGANGINDAGQITGVGMFNGQLHAFRLTPTTVPEPSALALLGVAAVAGFTARRKMPSATRRLPAHR
jgi:probable HAF family extracellular repeat protein